MDKPWSHRNGFCKIPPEERFWEKVDIKGSNECWNWTATKVNFGYGSFRFKNESRAHRIAWILTNGNIPSGICVCHKCDNPSCCNPAHLFLGSKADNSHDRDQKGRLAWGERNGPAKLSEQQVREIRELYATGDFTERSLGKIYGVEHHTIGGIIRGEIWKRLK